MCECVCAIRCEDVRWCVSKYDLGLYIQILVFSYVEAVTNGLHCCSIQCDLKNKSIFTEFQFQVTSRFVPTSFFINAPYFSLYAVWQINLTRCYRASACYVKCTAGAPPENLISEGAISVEANTLFF